MPPSVPKKPPVKKAARIRKPAAKRAPAASARAGSPKVTKKAAPAKRIGRPPGKARRKPSRNTIDLIKSAKIVNRLQKHIDSTVKSPLYHMSQSQVTAALGLLKKVLPDLAAAKVEVSGAVTVEVLKVGSH